MQPNDIRSLLIDLLAIVYNRISWSKMKTRHNPHDIFNHRVRAAARRANINQFASKLCNYFGLQTLPTETINLLWALEEVQEKALNMLYQEHIPICVMAIAKAKEIRERKKNGQQVLGLS